ncbi:DUF4129 domain-containing protein [Flavobacterium selenitireducens]|uniref:DUF4129 domain-containing protein n=1 Tax=Flavobacterium selenitireducens TaxID=2722704 RepID=UPI00168BCCE3|nr:DUF4129 domain-containing protein [Flavobacterium selenitireducens]MBD3582664.1 DUF4129 domain-containing protein [Flavobacterium selenitireducens]
MRKFLFVTWLTVASVQAQDSIVYEEPPLVAQSAVSDTIVERRFSPDFKQKYQSEEFNYIPKPEEETWWDRFKAWLARLIQKLFQLGGEESLTAAAWFFRILAIILVVVVIYLIVKSIMNKEGSWIFGRSTSKKLISADDIERNIETADFGKLIQETLISGDKRLAVRYYYLWVLQQFSKRGIIDWDIEKTNSDYLYEIKSKADKKDFAYLSYLFNYIWYGDFDLDEPTFARAVSAFEKTIKRN